MKAYIKDNWKIIVASAVLILIFVRYNILFWGFSKKGVYGGNSSVTILISILSIIGTIAVLFLHWLLSRKLKVSKEKVFLFLFLVLGLFQIIVTPIDRVPDEIYHIVRANQISKGDVIADLNENGDAIGSLSEHTYAIVDSENKYEATVNAIKAGDDASVGVEYNNTAGYHPIAYLPHIIGIFIGRSIGFSEVISIYMGRLFMLVFASVIIYYSIKIIPKYKDIAIFLALLPETIQQSMGYSADGLLICCSFLFIAICLKGIYTKDYCFQRKILALLYCLCVVIVVCKKITYLPVLGLLLVVPSKCFSTKKRKVIHVILMIMLSLAVTGVWMLAQEKTVKASSNGLTSLFAYPIDFIVRSVGSLLGDATNEYLDGFVGNRLGYNEWPARISVGILATLVFFVLLLYKNNDNVKIKVKERVIYSIIPIAIIFLIYFVAATQWEERTNMFPFIYGLQGRYLTPIAFLLPFIFQPSVKKNAIKPFSLDTIVIFSIMLNICTMSTKMIFFSM